MNSFDFLWQLLDNHGVIENKKADCAQLWDTFSLQEQRLIYRSIRDALKAGKFVNYNPVKAVRDHAPKPKPQQVISFDTYYNRYHTSENRDGWERVFLEDQHKTIYIKH